MTKRGGLIRQTLQQRFSHAAIFLGTGFVVESEIDRGGVAMSHLSTFYVDRADRITVLRLKQIKGQSETERDSLLERVCILAWQERMLDSYALREAAVLGVRRLLSRLLRISLPKAKPRTGSVFCSQLVALSFDKAGRSLFSGRDASEVSPGDIESSAWLQTVHDVVIPGPMGLDSLDGVMQDAATGFSRVSKLTRAVSDSMTLAVDVAFRRDSELMLIARESIGRLQLETQQMNAWISELNVAAGRFNAAELPLSRESRRLCERAQSVSTETLFRLQQWRGMKDKHLDAQAAALSAMVPHVQAISPDSGTIALESSVEMSRAVAENIAASRLLVSAWDACVCVLSEILAD